jgi:hypothetical protein
MALRLHKDAPDKKSTRTLHKEKRREVENEYLLARIELPAPIRNTPVVNGCCSLSLRTHSTQLARRKQFVSRLYWHVDCGLFACPAFWPEPDMSSPWVALRDY